MFSRQITVTRLRSHPRGSIVRCLFVLALAAVVTLSHEMPQVPDKVVITDDAEAEAFLVDRLKSIVTEVNQIRQRVLEEREDLRDVRTLVDATCRNLTKYPTATEQQSDPSIARFRRDDGTNETSESPKDYMNTYYARRKAILEKYNAQRKEITERLKKTRRLTTERKRLLNKESNATREAPTPVDVTPTIASNSHAVPKTTSFNPGAPVFYSTPASNNDVDESTEATSGIRGTPSTARPTDEIPRDPFDTDEVTTHVPLPVDSFDSLSRNELDFAQDNDTVIIDLGVHPLRKNDSDLEELDRMFSWDEGSTVRISNSPNVHITKNIKNVKFSTTTYKNSTLDEFLPTSDVDWTSPSPDTPDIGGGARESEWCEECPHDYKWGDCDGTLFYQHNIFLRNRGPSAIDAIFGMDVHGPVNVTCVEALRFNQTRGIVTLHSGGPGYDFARLRIRGFQGEGFSYIMKVWGVHSDEQSVQLRTN